jgi:hypothetical protein
MIYNNHTKTEKENFIYAIENFCNCNQFDVKCDSFYCAGQVIKYQKNNWLFVMLCQLLKI